MKQVLLAALLIALPVAVFSAVEFWLPPGSGVASASGRSASLGDLTGYEAIVSDTRKLVESGDLSGAEGRITDFEGRWDDAEASMRPKNPAAWGGIDAAADQVFAALRAQRPEPAAVTKALDALSATLSDPSGGTASGGVELVSGVPVTDANGHDLPCESMLGELRSVLSDGSIPEADRSKAKDLQVKATERCNADDDTHSNRFAAQAFALVKH